MFFQDHEKQIYSPLGTDLKFDPLAVLRVLTLASGNKLESLLADWQSPNDSGGAFGPDEDLKKALISAEAEGELARIARAAFNLPPFPDSTEAQALEYLRDYLEWMQGKGKRGETPPSSPVPMGSTGG